MQKEGGETTKIGRRGDVRMHKAVAARLENPDLTLFAALEIGGFDYADDNDATCRDSENITLGQRKNQLSRRLRLAKKADGNEWNDCDQSIGSARQLSTVKLPPSDNVLSGQKRSATSDVDRRIALVDAHAKSLRELQDRLSVSEQQRQREEPRAMAAKYHPDFHHIIIPRAASGGISSFAAPTATQPHLPAQQAGALPQLSAELTIQEQLMASGFTGGMNGFGLAKSQASVPPPSISNVAIRSLNSTCKSAGISLEQLALALSTSKNLMQLLSGLNCEGDDSSECEQKKYDLGLRLYEYETKTLYSRCMLLSGYPQADAAEGNPTQLRFALEAWQREGKRLQELIRNNSDATCDEAPLVHNVASDLGDRIANSTSAASSLPRVGTGTNNVSSHHDHSLTHYESGRHMHRLEGRCGHQAILHQPEGGTPHIDFVVGNKVECYGSIQPVRTGASSSEGNAAWPSQYKCEELACTVADQCSKTSCVGEEKVEEASTRPSKAKVIDLSSIDFLTTKEWKVDFDDDALQSLLALEYSHAATKTADQSRTDQSRDSLDQGDAGADEGDAASKKSADQETMYKI